MRWIERRCQGYVEVDIGLKKYNYRFLCPLQRIQRVHIWLEWMEKREMNFGVRRRPTWIKCLFDLPPIQSLQGKGMEVKIYSPLNGEVNILKWLCQMRNLTSLYCLWLGVFNKGCKFTVVPSDLNCKWNSFECMCIYFLSTCIGLVDNRVDLSTPICNKL